MPKISTVKPDDVNSIATEIFLAGEYPSINKVQSELRKKNGSAGSTAVITRLLNEWRESITQMLDRSNQLALDEPLRDLSQALAKQAYSVAEKSFEAERDKLQKTHQEEADAAQARLDEHRAEMYAMTQQMSEMVKTVDTLRQDGQAKQEEIQAHSSQIEALKAKITAQTHHIGALHSDMKALEEKHSLEKNEAQHQLEALKLEHQLDAAKQDQEASTRLSELRVEKDAEINRLTQQFITDLGTEKTRHEDEKKRLNNVVDSYRTQLKQARTEAAANSTNLTAQNQKLKSDYDDLIIKYATSEKEVSTIKETLSSMMAEIRPFTDMIKAMNNGNETEAVAAVEPDVKKRKK